MTPVPTLYASLSLSCIHFHPYTHFCPWCSQSSVVFWRGVGWVGVWRAECRWHWMAEWVNSPAIWPNKTLNHFITRCCWCMLESSLYSLHTLLSASTGPLPPNQGDGGIPSTTPHCHQQQGLDVAPLTSFDFFKNVVCHFIQGGTNVFFQIGVRQQTCA